MAEADDFLDSMLVTADAIAKSNLNCTSPLTNKNTSLDETYLNTTSCHLIGQEGSSHYYAYDGKIKYITLVFYMLTFVFGLSGNSLVIYIIWHFKKVRVKSVANYYIWNLALADVLFILSLPLFCWATYTQRWPMSGALGTISCKMAYIIRDINKFSSIFLLVALSVDRCLASFHQLGSFRTNACGKWVCVFIWVSCALIATPYLLYAQTITTHTGTSCRLAWPQKKSRFSADSQQASQLGFPYLAFWTYFQLLVGLLLPSILILASYVILYSRLRQIQLRHRDNPAQVKRPSKKMTQTVLVVVATFILCQTPYHVLQMIAQGKVQKSQEFSTRGLRYLPPQWEVTTFVYLNLVSQFLVFVSSCCNPIIYGLLNENYRRLYTEVLLRCGRGSSTHPGTGSPLALNTDNNSPKPTQQLHFQIKFHLPYDSYYWHKFWRQRKQRTNNRSIELDRLSRTKDSQCINGKEDILNLIGGLSQDTSQMSQLADACTTPT